MVILYIFCIIFFIAIIALMSPFCQWKLREIIDDSCFKLIKVKKLSFMFRAIDGKSVSKHGVIKSLFAIQLLGYIVALFTMFFAIIAPSVYRMKLETAILLTATIAGCVAIVIFVVICITALVSKKRRR